MGKVKVKFGKEVNSALIEEVKPDVVILATGGIFTNSEIPGSNKSNVVNSSDLHRRVKIFLRFFEPRQFSNSIFTGEKMMRLTRHQPLKLYILRQTLRQEL